MKSELLTIPSDRFALETELKQKKSKYMEQVYHVFETNYIDETIAKKKLKVFQFLGTNLIVILKDTQYKANLKNILDYYIEDEQYEKCELLKNILANIEEEDDTGDNTTST